MITLWLFFILHLGLSTRICDIVFCINLLRVSRTDFRMGGNRPPPIGGGQMGWDKGPMGGDWRMIRDKLGR